MKMKKLIFISMIILTLFTSCHNQDWDFPDYDYTTVYFSYQSPVRTIILGEDIYDNTLDNQHKCLIMATMGGVYENRKNVTIDLVVDNSICDSARFGTKDGDKILAMPSNYYSLPSDMKVVIPAGEFSGGIEVQLTDAFFADPLAIKNSYVIPLKMSSVSNADSILSGKSDLDNPNPLIVTDWVTVPKNYILYAVKYINPWHGSYLRRGVTQVKGSNGNSALDTTIVYHSKYVEKDQVVKMSTLSMDKTTMSLITRTKGSKEDISFGLQIRFDNAGKCTVSQPDTANYTVSGEGTFVNDGDIWGNKKRDVLYLKYNIDFGTSIHSFTDTIVMRDRDVTFETFTPVVQ